MKWILSLCLFLAAGVARAESTNLTAIPELTSPVIDGGRVLGESSIRRLDSLLREVNRRGTAQIQVLTIPFLTNETIEEYAGRVADKWQLGEKGKDNGVLILVSIRDRRSRIEVGRGLEGALPDVLAKQIQSQYMRPKFKNNDYAGAIEAGVDEVIFYADKEFPGNKLRPPKINWSMVIPLLEFGFLLLLVLIPLFGRRRRRRGGDWFWYGGGGSSGWGGGTSGGWGGGSSSGGSWGGGGGSFGGGGASDSW